MWESTLGSGRLSRRRLLTLALAGTVAPLLGRQVAAAAGSTAAAPTDCQCAPAHAVEVIRRSPVAVPRREDLPNGVVVVAEERRSADTVALQLSARAGSREDGDLPGLLSLTSRVMFSGTARRPSETALQRAVTLVGGSLSRATDTETSQFSAHVPADEAGVGFDVLADIVLDPLLDPAALARQREIALRSLAQRRADPNMHIADLFNAAIFAGHPAAIPALGTPPSLEAITPEAVAAARARYWLGANLVLAVVGRIGATEAIDRAARYLGALAPGSLNPAAPVENRPPVEGTTVRAEAGRQQAVFRIGFPAPALHEPDRYPMVVLNGLMSGSSGRLFESVRNQRGLAYTASSSYPAYTDIGAWFASAGVDPANLEAAMAVVEAELARLRTGPPPAEEFNRTIGRLVGRQVIADETNSARAARLSLQAIIGLDSTEEYVRRVRAVTPADVHRVALTYLVPERAVVAIVAPPG